MDDGFVVPGLHDGMAAFPVDDTRCLLIRNHELGTSLPPTQGPFGPENELLDRIPKDRLYDGGAGESGPVLGGTTSVLYDLRTARPVAQWLSLAGTGLNCAGGPTPWNTWITCEEWTQRADQRHARDHGFAFEVPATLDRVPCVPTPLRSMGRFHREAVAVDPKTGIVYQTEDRQDGAFYRFIPDRPGELLAGGRLQALAIRGVTRFDTRNWGHDTHDHVRLGEDLLVDWIDMDDPESPLDDLRYRAYEAGAARFARGEGIWTGVGTMHFACTTGRPCRGQLFNYTRAPGGHPGGSTIWTTLSSRNRATSRSLRRQPHGRTERGSLRLRGWRRLRRARRVLPTEPCTASHRTA